MESNLNISININPHVKSEVESIYSQYGMSISDAINVFLYTSMIVGGLPFDLRPAVPNAETLESIKEGNEIIMSGKTRFSTADAMFKELKT